MSVPYGQFYAAITPLLHWHTDFDASDYRWLRQFANVQFSHPLNDGRTASLDIPMNDPLVQGLAPYEQALLLIYVRPGVDPNLGERLIWGQCNVIDNYDTGTVTLQAQDPSLRLQHHYLRYGDDALNNPKTLDVGNIHVDDRGIGLLVKAGYYGDGSEFPLAPCLGLAVHARMENRNLTQEVHRGDEVWATITGISESVEGPDFDLKPNHHPDGALPGGAVSAEGKCYAVLHAFNPPYLTFDVGAQLFRDLTDRVIFGYGHPADNLAGVTVTPEHPTNDAIVVDSAQSVRSRARDPNALNRTGPFQDWTSRSDVRVGLKDWTILEDYAIAKVKTYGRPLLTVDVELRPDTGQDFFYGDPELTALGQVGDFYLGDIVTVRASRGYRSLDAPYRIVGVELSQSDSRGQLTTKLTLLQRPEDGFDYIIAHTALTTSLNTSVD